MNNDTYKSFKRLTLCVTVGLIIGLASTAAVAQRGGTSTSSPIPFGDGHMLYGDLKVGGLSAAAENSLFQVVLYAGMNAVQRQAVSNQGRFRFMGIPNGEYELAVEFEGREIHRSQFRLAERQKTDIQKNIQLEMRMAGDEVRPPPGVVPYARSAANQRLFDGAKEASDKKQAHNLFDQIVANDPKDFVTWTEIGTLFFKEDKLSEAEKAYLTALDLKPDFLLARLNLGKLQIKQKNYEAAIATLSKAIESEPKSAEAQQFLGEAYLQNKKGSKAVVHLTEALRLDPVGKAEVHLRLATLYNAAGMKDRAAAEYEQFLTKKPDYPERAKLQQYISENRKP